MNESTDYVAEFLALSEDDIHGIREMLAAHVAALPEGSGERRQLILEKHLFEVAVMAYRRPSPRALPTSDATEDDARRWGVRS